MNQPSQAQKCATFRQLHDSDETFLLPNPWDCGSTLLLENLGFPALATTSLGVSMSLGRRRATRQQVLENIRDINEVTTLPVNADLENGYADDPKQAAMMIKQAHEFGAVGGSLEDSTTNPDKPIYEFNHAVERVAAAVEVAASLPDGGLLLTARAENLLWGVNDIDDTIARLQAFEKVGADALYAPGLRTIEEIKLVCQSVTKPVNVVMGFADPSITLEDLQEAGVNRVSIGGALVRYATSAFLDAARQMRAGKFEFVADMVSVQELNAVYRA